jgi:hypothetical protein
MGCDIRPAIEFKQDGKWQAILTKNKYFGKWDDAEEFTASIDVDRNYELFAILGDVRNSDGIRPMSASRGIPEDISEEALEALSDEHSATWVTLAEILAYDWTRTATHSGWVNATEFERWDRVKEWDPEPSSYCGGGNFKRVSVEEMRELVHVATLTQDRAKQASNLEDIRHTMCRVEWELSYAQSGRQLWTKILPVMLKLGATHGHDNVRLVMDFDS